MPPQYFSPPLLFSPILSQYHYCFILTQREATNTRSQIIDDKFILTNSYPLCFHFYTSYSLILNWFL